MGTCTSSLLIYLRICKKLKLIICSSQISPGPILVFFSRGPWRYLTQNSAEDFGGLLCKLINLHVGITKGGFSHDHIPGVGGGVLLYKSDKVARRKIFNNTLKGTRILFSGHAPNSFPPLRDTNSTTKQGLFESIVINLYPNKAYYLWKQLF